MRKRYPLLADTAWLSRNYFEHGEPVAAMAARAGCAPSSVYTALRRHGLVRRDLGEARARVADPVWLRRRYLEDGATVAALAGELRRGHGFVYAALRRHGIPLRGGRRLAELADPVWLRRRYLEDGASMAAIAREVGCAVSQVWRHIRAHGIPRRRRGRRTNHA